MLLKESLNRAQRIAETFADLLREGRPRPIIVWRHSAEEHRICGHFVELQVGYLLAHGTDYDKHIAHMLETYYNQPGALGLGPVELCSEAAHECLRSLQNV